MNEMEKTINPDKYYYAKEAAELLPFSYKTFLKLIKGRSIQVSRPAGTRKFLVKGQAIIDYIDNGKLNASAFGLPSRDVNGLNPLAFDPASVYVELSEEQLETLRFSGEVLMRMVSDSA
jgi:hypothetical protein